MMRYFSLLLIMTFKVSLMSAQLLNKKGEEVHPTYIALDRSESNVIEFRGEFINISYRDRIGASESITFSVVDAKRMLLKEFKLVKQFGQNYFDINLEQKGISLLENEIYTLRIKNEDSEIFSRTIHYVSKLKVDISTGIIVKPKVLSCEGETGTDLIEFYGQINGGKAPYKANWYVLNATRTDFLYLPSHVIIPSAGLTSAIEVDQSPEYYVLLHVTDACGNEQFSTVNITCQSNEKKVNTIFFEKLDEAILRNGTKTETVK